MNATTLHTLEYRGHKVVIGKTPTYKLWRASIDGKQLNNAFYKSQEDAEKHCKKIIDDRIGQ
jgi:hypothetical protein